MINACEIWSNFNKKGEMENVLSMAMRVVEFSIGGHKIRKILIITVLPLVGGQGGL